MPKGQRKDAQTEDQEHEGPSGMRFPKLPGDKVTENLGTEIKKYQEIEARLTGKRSGPSSGTQNAPAPAKKVKESAIEETQGTGREHTQARPAQQAREGSGEMKEYPEVFVNGLSPTATDFDIRQHFKGVDVRSVKYLAAHKSQKMRSKCFVRVADAEAQAKALTFNNTQLDGHMISVVPVAKKAEPIRASKLDLLADTCDSKTILVRNLPADYTDEDLVNDFSEFGNLLSARIVRETNGLSKRYGFVEFVQKEDSRKALAKNGSEVKGQVIGVVVSVPKPPKEEDNGRFRINRGNYYRNPDKLKSGETVKDVKSAFHGETVDL